MEVAPDLFFFIVIYIWSRLTQKTWFSPSVADWMEVYLNVIVNFHFMSTILPTFLRTVGLVTYKYSYYLLE